MVEVSQEARAFYIEFSAGLMDQDRTRILAGEYDQTHGMQAVAQFQRQIEAAERARCAKVAAGEIVEIFDDSPEIDTVCNAVVREIVRAIRNGDAS